MSEFQTSADGTRLAYSLHGPADALAVIWIHGATVFRALHDVPRRFAEGTGLRVLDYDRRGRGESGDVQPYAVEREIEDITALCEILGGRVAALIGESSGAVLALEAARAGVPTSRVIAYEPPLLVDDSKPALPEDYVQRLDAAAAADDPVEAFRIFLTDAVGLPPEAAAGIPYAPNWEQLASVASTIRYDGRLVEHLSRGDAAALDRYRDIAVPVLVGVGGDTWPFIRSGAEALADALPQRHLAVFPGGTHQTDPELVGPSFAEFVRAGS